MKRKNNLIKSITVTPKPFEFKIGDLLWENRGMGLIGYRVIGEPKNTNVWMVPVELTEGIRCSINSDGQQVLFPGDLGVPGYRYIDDGRGCHLFRSRQAAIANEGKYDKWLTEVYQPAFKTRRDYWFR